jgi:two-component system, OmpR family, phosphate regulon sensor histidine kinase PhoR
MFLIGYFFSALLVILVGFLAGGWFGACCALFAACFSFAIYQSAQNEKWLMWLQKPTEELPDLSYDLDEIAARTQRLFKQKNSDLQSSDANLAAFLSAIQASPDGVVMLNYFNSIQWCNHMAEHHFGLDATRDQNQIVNNLIRDPLFSEYLSSNDYTQGIIITGHQHQIERPIKIAINLYPYANNAKLLLSRDITAIEQADAMRRDFVANVSHEIRTPLTVLSGFIEAFQHSKLSVAEQKKYLDLMAQQSMRMQSLTSDLLLLSRLEASPLANTSDSFLLSDLIDVCVRDAKALIVTLKSQNHLKIALEKDLSQAKIIGSMSEIQSALSNLISNAIRYTPAKGCITINSISEKSHLKITVSDEGEGIEPQHIARLTERFYRVDTSRSRETGGTGLGLAIVKHVMLRHGGELRIESTLGNGSQFSLLIPNARVMMPLVRE